MSESCSGRCSPLWTDISAGSEQRTKEIHEKISALESRAAASGTLLHSLDRQVQVLDTRMTAGLKEVSEKLDAINNRLPPLEIAKTTTIKVLLSIIAGLAVGIGVSEGDKVARFLSLLF